jgi:hypothetical protein
MFYAIATKLNAMLRVSLEMQKKLAGSAVQFLMTEPIGGAQKNVLP